MEINNPPPVEQEKKNSFLEIAKGIATQKSGELVDRAKKIKPGHLALAVALGAGAWILGDSAAEWSMKFAHEGESMVQGFANMMAQTAEASAYSGPDALDAQTRYSLGSFSYTLIPLFVGLAGGSIASAAAALRPAFTRKR